MLQNLLRLAFAFCLFVGGTGLVVCQATGHGINAVAPWQTGPVSVMIVEETSERASLTAGQIDVISSHAPDSLLGYLKDHGEKDPLRVVDKDDQMNQDDPKWQAAFAAKGASVPWLVIERGGKVLQSVPLPKDASETMRIVRRFGG